LDWFNSNEICLEAAGSAVALAFFVVHTWTAPGPSFLNRSLLHDRNFVTSVLFTFIVGMILYATMSLLPTLLQSLQAYPALYTGQVMAPRGIGTLLAMLTVGRLMHRIDLRAILAFGFGLTAFSLYQMTHMTLDMNSDLIVVSGFIQGMGVGFTFVPLSAAAFATLPPHLRNDGTPFYSLMRNIGSSVGISIVQLLWTESAVRAHANLVTYVNLANPALASLPGLMAPDRAEGLARLEAEVSRQSAMIAYVQDFRVMMVVALLVLPLLLLIQRPASKTQNEPIELVD